MRKSELIKEYERRLADKEEEMKRVIKNLTRDITELQTENRRLETKNYELHKTISRFESLTDIPDDCTMGPWCKVCVYSKTAYSFNTMDTVTYCDKNNSCQHFTMVKKEGER